VISCVTN
jgi:hypothetical protein